MPQKANVGQYLRVLDVDENGIVTKVEAVSANMGGDGGITGDVDAATLNGKTFDEIVTEASKKSVTPAIVNYSYESTTGSTSHARSYSGTKGNTLLLLVLTRGEITTPPEGWTLLGTLTESGDYDAGSVTYPQYVSAFTKECDGTENVTYEQTQSNLSITCFIEFEGVSSFEILEDCRFENVISQNPEFTCNRNSTRMGVWVATAVYFNSVYQWIISDSSIWAISDNHGISPRLGVFVDNRPTPVTFTIESGMDARYSSAFCIQIVP